MKELINQSKEPNIIEQAIIEWNLPDLKKHLTDQNLLLNSGYNQKEIDQMQTLFFGIRIPNPDQMSCFENAIYSNDKKTIEHYYRYMNNNNTLENYRYKEEDLRKIRSIYIEGNTGFPTSSDDYYEIASRLKKLQNNKNRMAEMYYIKYLDSSDLLNEKEAINSLVMIYRDEEYLPGRRDDFNRLIDKFPGMLEYSQLARSFHIELLYRDYSNEKRYQEICKKGDEYEKQLVALSEQFEAGSISEEELKEEEKKYVLEDKAKYLYAIAYTKNNGNGWKYFIKYKLYEQTNAVYMKAFLEASGEYLKIYLDPENENKKRKDYIKILHTMANKAKGKRAGANYDFLLYLNREFGSEYGISRDELEDLYKNADYGIPPFEHNGYGTYLYALAQEHKRSHGNIDEFSYKTEYLNLKKEYYSYYSRNIENYLLKSPVSREASKIKIECINNCEANGEKKFLQNKGYKSVQDMPRYLCFFPEQDKDLYDKYEDMLQNALKLAEKNSKKDLNMLKNLEISIIPKAWEKFDNNTDDILLEISFYIWKRIQLDFDNSKDQWLILAKIYEAFMNEYKQKADRERAADKKAEYNEIGKEWAHKTAVALQIRADLYFIYEDWYDLYQFYLGRAYDSSIKEKLQWVKLAYELYLEMIYKTIDDTDKVGRHVESLSGYYLDIDNNCFELCIKNYKSLASRYIEALAKLYYRYSQYRYMQFAFEIAKAAGEYKVYLKNFLKALIQWEMTQLIKNIHYLLREKNYEMAQEFYDYSTEHINNIPEVLSLTQELIEGLKTSKEPRYENIFNMLVNRYPNVNRYLYYENQRDESLMLDNIRSLEFIMKYYTSTKDLVGDIDCSSIYNAFYKQYERLYECTMKEEYLVKMLEALISAGKENTYLPYLYKAITICYRYDSLNAYTDSIINNDSLKAISYKLKEYQELLERLRETFGNDNRDAFYELCNLRIYPANVDNNKAFIKNYLLSGRYRVTDELRDYLMYISMVSTAWLRLYFEEHKRTEEDRPFAEYAMAFDSVRQVIEILESSRKASNSLINIDNFKACVYYPLGKNEEKSASYIKASAANSDPYKELVKDYLKNGSDYTKKNLELLHHFFTAMSEDMPKYKKLSLYNVIDSINKESGYKNDQCFNLLDRLYKGTRDPSYLTALARQYAKAFEYKKAETYYSRVLERAENNEALTEKYAYIRPIKLSVYLLDLAKNNKKVKLEEKISIKEYCEVLTHISDKYYKEINGLMEGMEEDDRNLLSYISQLVSEEGRRDEERNLELLFKKLLLLKDTKYFEYLLPNLYQWSKSEAFKVHLEQHENKRIQGILKERKNKPILVLSKQRMKQGQRLIYMDYARQASNVNVNSSDENQDSPLLQEAINAFYSKDRSKKITDLLLQLEVEKNLYRRKNILLCILSYQFDNPEGIEGDDKPQRKPERKLQLAKAELGYLLHIEEFDKQDYEMSIKVLHEGVRFLGNNKSDCRFLIERIRERYIMVLDIIPSMPFDRALKLFPIIAGDMHKIVHILNNNNNSENVVLKEMVSVIYHLQTFGNPLNQDSDVVLLEMVMDLINDIKDKEAINKKKWFTWIYRELIQIVNRDTIINNKYFIDRKENNATSLEKFYRRVIEGSDNINLHGPRGMGVSSLLRQCYQVYIKEALYIGKLFLYLDGKEINNSYDNKKELKKRIYEQIKRGIQRVSEFSPHWEEKLLEIMEQYDEPLDCIDAIGEDEDIDRIHLFIDHYEELRGDTKDETDLLLKKLEAKGAHLVLGSEAVIKVELVDFSEVELMRFTKNETKDYIENRMKYNDGLKSTIPLESLHKLTGGTPVLLSYSMGSILQNNSFSEADVKQELIYKAKLLFEHWEVMGVNGDYLSHIMKKNDLTEQGIKIIKELGENLEAKMDAKLEANDAKLTKILAMIESYSKQNYADEYDLVDGDEIDLNRLQRRIPWKEERDVNVAEYSMSDDAWAELYKDGEIHQYIRYGEAHRVLTAYIQKKSTYDYSTFSLSYCLAFEAINNNFLKNFLMERIPEYNVAAISKDSTVKVLGDSKDTTTYTVGQYLRFLRDYNRQSKYQNEISKVGFNFKKFINDYSKAVDIRNDMAHVGNTLDEERYNRILYLLFGYKKYKDYKEGDRKPTVLEGILRLVKIK